MGFEDFKDKARQGLEEIQALSGPIADLDSGHWTRDVSLEEGVQRDLSGLGTLELQGSIGAALHLIRRNDAPEDLERFVADPEETQKAVASVVVNAHGGAKFRHQQTIAAGAGITLGAEAAAQLAFAQHQRVTADETGLAALGDLISNLRNPYDIDSLRTLTEHELFHVEFSGTGSFSATAGWQWGLVRSFEGTELERLVPGDLGGVRAGFKAGLTATVGVEGEFRVRVDRSPRDPRQIRVRLHKKRGSFVGAGLSIDAEVQLTQPDSFVDSVLARLLQVPDGLVDRLIEIRSDLAELHTRLTGLAQGVKDEIAAAVGVAEDALGLDDLERLRAKANSLPDALAQRLAPLFELLERVRSTIDDTEGQLTEFVDDALRTVSDPLDRLSTKLESWIDAYQNARQRALELIKERAREGIKAEFTAGINRTKTSTALLELGFELESTGLLLVETMKGNFIPALERATTPGATGVEIIGGFLKESIKKRRFYSLRFNLFGFSTAIDFQRWNQVDVMTDAKTGTMSISGQAGARLTTATNRRSNELSFLFDVYGAFERRGDAFLTTPETSFRAVLDRTGGLDGAKQIKPMVPRHLEGARRLRLLGEERKEDLQDALLGNPSSKYNYDFRLSVPPTAIRRMLSLDVKDSRKNLNQRLWVWMREAVDILDYPVPNRSGGITPLSSFFVDDARDAVNGRPIVQAWQDIDHFRDSNGKRFQDGAYRMVWAYLLNARAFVEAYLDIRESLLGEERLRNVVAKLGDLAATTVKGVGSFTTRPFDAKYLVLVLAEGFKEIELRMRFQRGSVDVTI